MSSRGSPIELTILSVEPRDSYVQDQVRHCVWPSEGLFAYLYVHHAASYVYIKKKKKRGDPLPLSFNLVKVQVECIFIGGFFFCLFSLFSETGPNIFSFFFSI